MLVIQTILYERAVALGASINFRKALLNRLVASANAKC